jgi:hypothetical protein
MTIQTAPAVAAHPQSRAAEMVRVPVPPLAVNEELELVAVIWHLLALGAATEVDAAVHPAAVRPMAAAKHRLDAGKNRCIVRPEWLPMHSAFRLGC